MRRPAISNQITNAQPSRQRAQPQPRLPATSGACLQRGHERSGAGAAPGRRGGLARGRGAGAWRAAPQLGPAARPVGRSAGAAIVGADAAADGVTTSLT